MSADKSLIKCHVCKALVRSDRLEKHFKRIHKDSISQNRELPKKNIDFLVEPTKPNVPANREMTTCKVCKTYIRADRLQSHLKRVHRDISRIKNDPDYGLASPRSTANRYPTVANYANRYNISISKVLELFAKAGLPKQGASSPVTWVEADKVWPHRVSAVPLTPINNASVVSIRQPRVVYPSRITPGNAPDMTMSAEIRKTKNTDLLVNVSQSNDASKPDYRVRGDGGRFVSSPSYDQHSEYEE